jgi:glycosyltransferase involved in cell wall biosynthesis
VTERIQGLSAVIITLNEERRIQKAIESVAFAEEVLVVDSGSQDQTCAIAQGLGARVLHQAWLGYGAQKQFAAELATYDWVLCIDADEWISDELEVAIREVFPEPELFAYKMARCNRFLGRWLRHGEGYPDYNLRLFHRAHARWSQDPVHEHVLTENPVGSLDGDLMHESEESLEQYLAKQNQYTTLQAEQLYQSGKRFSLGKLLLSPIVRFFKMLVLRQGLRDGIPGLIHISIGCMNTFSKNMKLYERLRNAKNT